MDMGSSSPTVNPTKAGFDLAVRKRPTSVIPDEQLQMPTSKAGTVVSYAYGIRWRSGRSASIAPPPSASSKWHGTFAELFRGGHVEMSWSRRIEGDIRTQIRIFEENSEGQYTSIKIPVAQDLLLLPERTGRHVLLRWTLPSHWDLYTAPQTA
ncbi:hypothetical protein PG994_005330 [Apiospora phragmitis]|uniref:Uncharacterized protein n=1 Tax=Apiospora phragmitis TaxID=2905665 RepID=A0ABR1VBY6_9PEZI